MEKFLKEGTNHTPKVIFDPEKSSFKIAGRSIPENSNEFYKPIITYLEQYVEDPNEETEFTFKLEYFNTSSSKCILDILCTLEKVIEKGKQIKVSWYYHEADEDMLEAGRDFEDLIDFDMEYISYDEYY